MERTRLQQLCCFAICVNEVGIWDVCDGHKSSYMREVGIVPDLQNDELVVLLQVDVDDFSRGWKMSLLATFYVVV